VLDDNDHEGKPNPRRGSGAGCGADSRQSPIRTTSPELLGNCLATVGAVRRRQSPPAGPTRAALGPYVCRLALWPPSPRPVASERRPGHDKSASGGLTRFYC